MSIDFSNYPLITDQGAIRNRRSEGWYIAFDNNDARLTARTLSKRLDEPIDIQKSNRAHFVELPNREENHNPYRSGLAYAQQELRLLVINYLLGAPINYLSLAVMRKRSAIAQKLEQIGLLGAGYYRLYDIEPLPPPTFSISVDDLISGLNGEDERIDPEEFFSYSEGNNADLYYVIDENSMGHIFAPPGYYQDGTYRSLNELAKDRQTFVEYVVSSFEEKRVVDLAYDQCVWRERQDWCREFLLLAGYPLAALELYRGEWKTIRDCVEGAVAVGIEKDLCSVLAHLDHSVEKEWTDRMAVLTYMGLDVDLP